MGRIYHIKEIIRSFSTTSFHSSIPRRACWFSTALFQNAHIHRLLNEIPIGKMSADNLTDAKSLILKWCEAPSFQDAERAEVMLDRLITEHSDGRNQSVHLPLSVYIKLLEAYAKCGTIETGPLYAHNLLQRMIQRHEEFQPATSNMNSNISNSLLSEIVPSPDIICYNTVLHGWAHSSHPLALEKMESLISLLEHNVTTGAHPQPNTSTYNILINAYANHASHYGYAQKAEDVLLKMANINSHNQSHVRPNTTSFNIVLKGWKNCHEGIECAQRAESILRLMMKLESQGHYQVRPNVISYCTVINAYGDNIRLDKTSSGKSLDVSDSISASLDGAMGVFHLFRDSSTALTHGAVSKCLSILIDTMGHICQEAIAKSMSSSQAAKLLGEKYIQVLDLIKQAKSRGLLTDNLSLTLCHTMLDCLQISTRERCKTHEILNTTDTDLSSIIDEDSKMHDPITQLNSRHMCIILEGILNGSHGIAPDTSCVNRLLRVYIRIGDEVAAEQLFHSLVRDESPNIDLTTFCVMTDLFYQSKQSESANKCLDVVQAFQSYLSSSASSVSGYDHRKINYCFNSAISKFCKTKNPVFIQHAYDILMKRNTFSQEMGLIDIIHYNMVLSSLLNVGITHPCAKARDILKQMQQNREAGYLGPDAISCTHAIQIFLKFGGGQHAKDVMNIFNQMNSVEGFPFDAMVFEHTLNALTSGGNTMQTAYAKEVFGRMRELNDQKKVAVTATACNIFLKSLSASPRECHDALIQMIHDYKHGNASVLPDRVGFNTVIQAWSSSKNENAFERASDLLEMMIVLNGEEVGRNLGPDRFTVSTLLSVIVNNHRSEAGIKADELMMRVSNIPDLHLDSYAYNRQMSAWAKSSSKLKLQRVLEILRESQRAGKSDLVSYNTALNAFAHSNTDSLSIVEKEEILSNAFKVYDELCLSKIRPDDVTFTTMLRVISTLSSNTTQRDEKTLSLFKNYCRQGIVTTMVTKLLCNLIPDMKHRKTLFQHSLEGKIDKYWTRNIKSVRLK